VAGRLAIQQAGAPSSLWPERNEPLDRCGVERAEFVEFTAGFRVEAGVFIQRSPAAQLADHQGVDVAAERFDFVLAQGRGRVEGGGG
jgi:hypothetical protein